MNMRIVSQEINNALEANKNAPANFGLVFNKWLVFTEDRGIVKPVVSQNKQPLIDSYGKSSKQAGRKLKYQDI